MTTVLSHLPQLKKAEITAFKALIRQHQVPLGEAIANLETSPNVLSEDWLTLLEVALDAPQNLPGCLARLNLSDPVLSRLFEATTGSLEGVDRAQLYPLLLAQQRVMRAYATRNDPGYHLELPQRLKNLANALSHKHKTQSRLTDIIRAIVQEFDYASINIFFTNQGAAGKVSLEAAIWAGVVPSREDMRQFGYTVSTGPNIVQDAMDRGKCQIFSSEAENNLTFPDGTSVGLQVAVPLRRQQQTIGILHLCQLAPAHLEAPAITIAQAIAALVTLAIENTYLQHTLQQYKRAQFGPEYANLQVTQKRLAEVSAFYTLFQEIISTLHLEDLLDHLVDTLRQTVDCRACVIFLLDETEQYLEIKAASGLKPKWKEAARLKVGEGAAGQCVAQKTTLYIPDTQKDPNFIFFDHAVRSLIVVPMIHRGKTIGAINLDDSAPDAFDASQERLLSIAATQAAIAIENAILFSRARFEEQRTRAIIHHMADGLLMVGPNGEITHVNSRLASMLGLKHHEIIKQNVYAVDLNPQLAVICGPATLHERTGVLATEVTISEPQELILRIFASSVTNEQGQFLGEVRVVHDVTKERALEKMKDDLMAMVSHELRTPLFAIRGMVQLLLDDTSSSNHESQQEILGIIDRESNQLAELVTNLLDSEKLSAGTLDLERQPLEVAHIIRQTVRKLHGLAQSQQIKLIAQVPDSLPLTLGDESRLEQVFTNLIGNAIKFTPEEGSIEISAAADSNAITVRIIDTGIGIAEADRSQIFDKFYQAPNRTSQSQDGSGLGLHIAKRLIEKHGGHLWVDSELGRGSTFYLKIPILT